MKYRRIGNTGLKVSELCMGTMQFGWTADERISIDILNSAFDAGIQFVDTADIYSTWVEGNPGGISESIIGKWLKEGLARRDQVVITTKVGGPMGEGPNDGGLSRSHIISAAEASLHRLGTDYIDLYLLHWPDDATPIEETLTALDFLVQRGDVRYIGCSNYSAWRIVEALCLSKHRNLARFISLQPEYNLIHRAEYERECEAVCKQFGLGVTPYSPLAGGFLTGKYKRGEKPPEETRGSFSEFYEITARKDRNWEVVQSLHTIATTRENSPSQIALAWLLACPTVTSPIIGPRNLEQLKDNLGAVDLKLSDEEIAILDEVSSWQEQVQDLLPQKKYKSSITRDNQF